MLARGGKLHGADPAGNRNDRNAGKAEGRCVAQDPAAGLGIVRADIEPGHRRSRQQEKFMLLQQFVDSRTELGMVFAQNYDLGIGDARAPLEPLADCRLDSVEVAVVNACGLPSLNGREDLK